MEQAGEFRLIHHVQRRLERLEKAMAKLRQENHQFEHLIDVLGREMQKVHEQFAKVYERFDLLEARLDQKVDKAVFEKRMTTVEQKLDMILDALAIKR